MFASQQWRVIWVSVFVATAGGGGLSHAGIIGVLDGLADRLLMVSVMLLGFTVTAVSLVIKAAHKTDSGSHSEKLLFGHGAKGYHSLVNNARLLVVLLFLNSVLGFVLPMLEAGAHWPPAGMVKTAVEAALLAELAFTGCLLWYAVTRYVNVYAYSKKRAVDERDG